MKHIAQKNVVRFGSLIAFILILAGCGNNNGDDLPTRFQLPIDTPTQQVETLPPVLVLPSPTSSETVEPSESPTLNEVATEIPIGPTPMLPVDVVQDYSILSVGEGVVITGELVVEMDDEGDDSVVLLVDAVGNELEVMLPPGIADTLLGQLLEITGIVVAAEESTSGRLAVRPSAINTPPPDSPDDQETVTPSSGFDPGNLPTAEVATMDALLAPVPGAERPLGIQITPSLPPLETYDMLMTHISAEVENLMWIALRSSSDTGYRAEFWDEEEEMIIIFRVDTDGGIHISSALSLPGTTFHPINRAAINTNIAELLANDPLVTSMEGALAITLEATNEESAVWTVTKGDAVVAIYNAIVLPE